MGHLRYRNLFDPASSLYQCCKLHHFNSHYKAALQISENFTDGSYSAIENDAATGVVIVPNAKNTSVCVFDFVPALDVSPFTTARTSISCNETTDFLPIVIGN